MRITAGQKIAGYSAVKIRELMRRTGSRPLTPQTVRQILGCSKDAATCTLNRLHSEGFLNSVDGHWTMSTRGAALAMATAAAPLRRATASGLIADLVGRGHEVNADDTWAYRIETLVVFGSYVRGADRPNDVDVACELRPRWRADKQQAQEQLRRRAREGEFRNLTEWAAWPKLEVFRFLKARSRGLSIHELEDWILQSTDHQVVFEHGREVAEERMPTYVQDSVGTFDRLPPEQKVGGSNPLGRTTFQKSYRSKPKRGSLRSASVRAWDFDKPSRVTRRCMRSARGRSDG